MALGGRRIVERTSGIAKYRAAAREFRALPYEFSLEARIGPNGLDDLVIAGRRV